MVNEAALSELLSLWEREQAHGRDLPAAELCRDRPELAPELERRIRALRQMNGLAQAAPETASLCSAESELTATVAASASLPALPGYEVLGKLGAGGMGVVFRARDLTLKRTVAIKQLLHPAPSGVGLARFQAEAEALARLHHPHVVQVHAAGEQDGRPYFVMEHVEGGGLDRRIHGQPQPPADAARLVMLLARAVHAAHQQGIIHRDLKPANILLAPPADEPALNTAYGLPKVSDFGLSKALGEDQQRTADGAIVGTPGYMAPEQATGRLEDVGPATDVYALGAILYELLTGRAPFRGRSLLETLEQVRTHPPQPLKELQPDVPPALEAVCLRCLAKAPADRYPSAQALADDLGRFLAGKPTPPPQPGRRMTSEYRPSSTERKQGCSITVSVSLTVLAVGVVLGGVGTVLHWGRGTMHTDPLSNSDHQNSIYKGYIDVLIWRRTPDQNLRMRLTDDEALPLHDGDEFRIEAKVTPAAYLYLFGIDTEGKVSAVYPWNPRTGWGSRPAREDLRENLSLPENKEVGWGFSGGKEGMETFLLLARPTPLDADDVVRGWFEGLPPQRPVQNARSAVWFDNGRMVEDDPRRTRANYEERPINDPLLRLRGLMERLEQHAAFTTAVSFAKRGK
jgi:serine/threonine protein kinase